MTEQQVQKTQGRKLFNYYIQQNTQVYNSEKQFFYRTNRWRFNTKDLLVPQKFMRVKYPLLVAGAVIIAYDWTYGWRRQDGHH